MSAAVAVPRPGSVARILLVDDDPVWRMTAARALRERGFEVADLDRAQDLAAALLRERPDCAVAVAPGAGPGAEALCRRLRAPPGCAHLPVLLLAASDEEGPAALACDAGACDWCVKSVNWTLLAHRVRQLLRVAALEREASGGRPPVARIMAGGLGWRPAGRRVHGCAELFSMLDWPDAPPPMHDRRLLALVAAPDRRRLRRAVAGLLADGQAVREEVGVTTVSGRRRRLRVDVHQVVTSPDGALALGGSVHDVTPARAGRPDAGRAARQDPLTGLPNRAWLLDRLNRAGAAPADRGLVLLGIDRFGPVSEALGQAATDRLLVEIAQRLGRLSGRAGTAAPGGSGGDGGRIAAVIFLGGEAFGLLLEGLAGRDAGLAVARSAVAALRDPFHAGGRELFLRASAGVHVGDAGVDDRSSWLGRADLARRSAGALGGNCALAFESTMAESGPERIEMERDLHYALQRGEMSMHFQPQFSASTRRLIGFEALMRWARQGTMQPAACFIPLAEETGLIVPLGEWAIGESCAALAALRALGHDDCVMSVNLSCQQLRTGRLPAVVAAALAAHGVPASQLEVELTESGMMLDPEVAVAELKAVRALGAGLAVDDFGTGYSSLAYLTRLPLTTLKIDRSFVQDIDVSERSLAVARAIVALGENLHLRVVAEGVETEPQRRALMALGCDLQQGYLYGRAVPLSEALRMAPALPVHRIPLETTP